MRDIKGGRGDPICRITVDAEHSCCVVLRCRSCRPEYACSPRPKTAMQAGCHLLVCETFCWSGLNSSPAKRMERQRSSSSLAGLGRDLALNGSFGRVRDECRSPEWRAEIVAVSVESVSQSRASRASRYSRMLHGPSLAQRQHCQGSPNPGVLFPRRKCAESAN